MTPLILPHYSLAEVTQTPKAGSTASTLLTTEMRIQTALLPDQLAQDAFTDAAFAVVIDTLRFTTTACRAIELGASSLHVAGEVDAARAMAAKLQAEQIQPLLLCGERLCRPIPGFDLGNSPGEYTPESVAGKSLVFTTTNGTRAVRAARAAQRIALAALINRAAVANWLLAQRSQSESVWIICSGTDGQLALEDVLAAGALLEALLQSESSQSLQITGDPAWLALTCWQGLLCPETGQVVRPRLLEALRTSLGGSNLIEAGYADDVEFASQVDICNAVPESQASSWACFEDPRYQPK
ncbi:MAG: 2-phosphosulfolactate phosphatase [bacterium]|nr:2-phosphosulfolactate phosphatase [bacterium]